MNFNQKKQSIIENRKQYSIREKISILYILFLVLLLIIFPIIEVGSLNSTDVTSFSFFSQDMLSVNLISIFSFTFMLLWNGSKTFQKTIEKSFGFVSNSMFINSIMLLIVLVGLFAIGDTVSLLQSQYSKIEASLYLSIAQTAVVIGIIINIIGSRIKENSRLPRAHKSETEIIEKIAEAEAFKKVEKEFGGLFTDDQ